MELINIPLTFAVRGGRRRGSASRGRRFEYWITTVARKRDRRISIIEPDIGACHVSKKRALLVDEHSENISAETAEQSRREL
ncbi:UNVERIFIED_CONTAM: hypothetical protein Slati_2119100 [Sesamum latifolium]|uniref:Uncharacterized protein n=1 Tax=Sesamum latifolium TaxID=2727402 RepID=A0AAW2WQ87_9LAMI